MKRLLPVLCLTIAVLLGSVGVRPRIEKDGFGEFGNDWHISSILISIRQQTTTVVCDVSFYGSWNTPVISHWFWFSLRRPFLTRVWCDGIQYILHPDFHRPFQNQIRTLHRTVFPVHLELVPSSVWPVLYPVPCIYVSLSVFDLRPPLLLLR